MMISLEMVLRFSYWFLSADFDAMARSSIAHNLRFFWFINRLIPDSNLKFVYCRTYQHFLYHQLWAMECVLWLWRPLDLSSPCLPQQRIQRKEVWASLHLLKWFHSWCQHFSSLVGSCCGKIELDSPLCLLFSPVIVAAMAALEWYRDFPLTISKNCIPC